MLHIRTVLVLLVLVAPELKAQSLYMPRDVKKAYVNQTRSMDGKPGKNYWQNRGRYAISVTVLPPDRTVRGSETITYFNQSPDTITAPVLKLILNIHKPGSLRLGDASEDYLSSGVHIDKFEVNGLPSIWSEPRFHSTWQQFPLAKPLMPNDSVQLTIDWHYTLSLESGREGMIDSTTCFLAYFYPRVAVYDDYLGWDRMNFTDGQEFYNDFNDYTLTVHVPKNYLVWATGILQNPGEVLQPEYADRLQQSMTTDELVHVASAADLADKKITRQAATNAWKWTADHISDVAVAISDHYVWDASSVIVDTVTHRRASVQAAFNDIAQDFHDMVGFGRHALSWLSDNWPGVPYPFPKTTLVQGYADMEYPMMVNDGSTPDTSFSKFVAEHEIAHTWFPFYMGINETRYGFMDEGWATTFEYLIGTADRGKATATRLYKNFRINRWIHDKNAEEDIPIITPGNALSGPGLGNNEYGKASLGYLAMKDYLGDDEFKKCLHAYMDRWHGKHPIPWDFFNTFTDVSGKNLNWFWNAWYFSNGYIDLSIDQVMKKRKAYEIIVKNIGGFPAPTDLTLHYTDGSTEIKHLSPAVWEVSLQQARITIDTRKILNLITMDGGIFMDADTTNNQWKP